MSRADVREVTLVEAVNMALAWEMAQDESVIVLGEDVATNGGVFRATVGLRERFGYKRVMDTPLAENLIAGTAIGMATQGLKPVAEFQFMGFIYAGMEQIISHAARMRNRTRGRLHCQIVYRAPFGGGIHAPEHHSESTEALFAHIPGLRVVVPSSPQRAYGLLLAAIRNPDPVLFLEPKRIYRAVTQSVVNNGESLPLDTCYTLREGDDVTLVTWGACVMETLQAADTLAQQGVLAEVIDVATVSPLDRETLLCSVAKTGRAVIVHEACRNGGVGAEIAASIAEGAFLDLQAPVVRVTGYDTIMPYYRNEQAYLPQVQDIVEAVEQVIAL
ncbi:alpha-ketoacid dehydrogenase subunit beta [Marinobacter salinisoli]|uniref:Alpha-ketoacid dehydrogenase subunit beta n=1 Tax=Marinobacter salinisoli TaxID=2769486 RepID=A0ABX7MYG1_9GAMM|nr:alpha-ketoacid dehydrogenase subunit beta [Marinobacter salinisoli]QSP96359.1 alpha-ketoacid dehydrogenase subunit beta [Marinobacter salinisoli]